MAKKEVLLELAAFMDSPQAQALENPPKESVRSIVGKFLSACVEDFGTPPHQLDGQGMHGVLGHLLPSRFSKGDALAEFAPDVLRTYLDFVEEQHVVADRFEMRSGFESTVDEFLQTVRTGKNVHGHHHHQHVEPQKPVQHGAPKLGRNDPCSCGSGKKYKKCHGR